MKLPFATLWKIDDDHCPKREILLLQRRNTLFSRFTLLGLVISLVHAVVDGAQGFRQSALFDTGIGAFILVAYLLNRAGRHNAGKIFLIGFLNVALTFYCSIVSKHHGVYLYYFPLIGLSYVVFDYQHRMAGIFFVGLSMACLVGLVVTDFRLLGDIRIPSANERDSFLINLSSSALILVVCINFMMKYNDESERGLMKLAEENGQKNIHLEKTNAELDRFVYSASHDLRAPLLSIQGIINIARHENENPVMESYLKMINCQALKLDSFIKDIINYSQNSRTEVAEQPINLDHVLEGVLENLKSMEGAEKITWEKKIDKTIEWKTDTYRIGTVLNNLLSNAVKYHNYSRDDRWIKIGVSKNCSACCITVMDNGVGIPLEHQKKVFDMFYRAHDNSNGSGLGLYIVKEIVSKMNGTIHLQSQPGQGSTFTITLPVLAA